MGPRLSPEQLSEAIRKTRGVELVWDKAALLTVLAPHLSMNQLGEALAIAREMKESEHKVKVLSTLALLSSQEERLSIFSEAYRAALQIEEDSAKVKNLIDLAPKLTLIDRLEILSTVLRVSASRISWDRRRELFAWVATSWKELDFKDFPPNLFHNVLHSLGQHDRFQLTEDLIAILPIIDYLGGQAAVIEVVYALRDVTKWWP